MYARKVWALPGNGVDACGRCAPTCIDQSIINSSSMQQIEPCRHRSVPEHMARRAAFDICSAGGRLLHSRSGSDPAPEIRTHQRLGGRDHLLPLVTRVQSNSKDLVKEEANETKKYGSRIGGAGRSGDGAFAAAHRSRMEERHRRATAQCRQGTAKLVDLRQNLQRAAL